MVILHLVIQKCVSTPGTFVSILVNTFAYVLCTGGKILQLQERQKLYSLWSCAAGDLYRITKSLQHFCKLKQFPGMYCLTIATLHGILKHGSLFPYVEVNWLSDQPRSVKETDLRRSQKYSHYQILCP